MRYWRFYVDREIVTINPKTRRKVKAGTDGAVEEGGDHARVVDVIADDREAAEEKIAASSQAPEQGEAFGEIVELRPSAEHIAEIEWVE